MSADSPPNGTDRLNGWKEIAAYLGKSVRSVQRWEGQLRLPVRRIKTADGQIVGASRREIDVWRAQLERSGHRLDLDIGDELDAVTSSEPDPPPHVAGAVGPHTIPVPRPGHSSRVVLALFMVFAMLTIGYGFRWWWWPAEAASPAAFVLAGTTLEFRDRTGRAIGTYPFGRDVSGMFGQQQRRGMRDDALTEVDLDGDGTMEHLVPVHFGPLDRPGQFTDALYVFSDTRRMVWNAAPVLTFSCEGKTLEGPWRLNAVQVSSGPAPRRIWMAYTHHKDSISFVVEVKSDGQQSLRYLQDGWIVSLAEWMTPAGPRLVAGGVVHDADQPSVVLLDPDAAPVFSPNTNPRNTCDDVPAGRPTRVVLLPNLDVTIAQGTPYSMVHRLKVAGEDLEAEGDDVVATFGPDGTVKDFMFSDVYWGRHRSLEAEGKLDHSASECPEATKSHEIVTWTSGGPRQTYLVQPTNTRTTGRR